MTHSGDTRVRCTDCREYSQAGTCRAVARAELRDAPLFPPDCPAHCVGFKAKEGAQDARSGAERFPHAWKAYVRAYGPPVAAQERVRELRRAIE